MLLELRHGRGLAFLAQDADVSVRVFQVGRHVDLIQSHENAFESNLARNDAAQLAL
jgi:hypothetical protein